MKSFKKKCPSQRRFKLAEGEKMTIKGIKKAVGEFNRWQGAARIYYDISDGHVWTNIYPGPERCSRRKCI